VKIVMLESGVKFLQTQTGACVLLVGARRRETRRVMKTTTTPETMAANKFNRRAVDNIAATHLGIADV
jgi:hypothetical protein